MSGEKSAENQGLSTAVAADASVDTTGSSEKPQESAPKKNKGGRPKGYPKTGGRKKTPRGSTGKEARLYLAENSGYLEVLCRTCAGKPIRIAGPTGKEPVWHYPDWRDRRWAAQLVAKKSFPELQVTQLSGPEDGPIKTRALDTSPLGTTDVWNIASTHINR